MNNNYLLHQFLNDELFKSLAEKYAIVIDPNCIHATVKELEFLLEKVYEAGKQDR